VTTAVRADNPGNIASPIVIAHHYPETLDFLEQVLKDRPEDSVQIAPASAL